MRHDPARHRPTPSLDIYSDEERQFLQAIDRFKREHHRPHPTLAEVFALAWWLGYRPVAPMARLPKRK